MDAFGLGSHRLYDLPGDQASPFILVVIFAIWRGDSYKFSRASHLHEEALKVPIAGPFGRIGEATVWVRLASCCALSLQLRILTLQDCTASSCAHAEREKPDQPFRVYAKLAGTSTMLREVT